MLKAGFLRLIAKLMTYLQVMLWKNLFLAKLGVISYRLGTKAQESHIWQP